MSVAGNSRPQSAKTDPCHRIPEPPQPGPAVFSNAIFLHSSASTAFPINILPPPSKGLYFSPRGLKATLSNPFLAFRSGVSEAVPGDSSTVTLQSSLSAASKDRGSALRPSHPTHPSSPPAGLRHHALGVTESPSCWRRPTRLK